MNKSLDSHKMGHHKTNEKNKVLLEQQARMTFAHIMMKPVTIQYMLCHYTYKLKHKLISSHNIQKSSYLWEE